MTEQSTGRRAVVRCLCAAPVLHALIVATELSSFRRIDSSQANARAVNFESVVVNDAGLPDQVVRPALTEAAIKAIATAARSGRFIGSLH